MDHSKQASEVFDKLAELYQSRYMDVSAYQPELDTFLAMLVPSSPRVLEIACGPGNISSYLLSQSADLQLLGIDLAPGMIKLARQNCPTADFRVMDCRQISTLDTKYDGIIVGFCLPYLTKDEVASLLSAASDLLNQDGIIYLSLIEDDHALSGYKKGSTGDEIFMHYYQFGDIGPLLQKNGLEICVQRRITVTHHAKPENELLLLGRNQNRQ